MAASVRDLHRLARLYGVQTAYYDVNQKRQMASPDSLLVALRELGACIGCIDDVHDGIQNYWSNRGGRGLEPVLVVWDHESAATEWLVPHDLLDQPALLELHLETGDMLRVDIHPNRLETLPPRSHDAPSLAVKRLELPAGIPFGYHRLTLNAGSRHYDSFVISAPRRAYSSPDPSDCRKWGCFLPLYALKSTDNWGTGNYSDLKRMADWIDELNGQIVGTLPLLPTFLEQPYDPSPYSPISRLFWNEFFIDLPRIPDVSTSPHVQSWMQSPETRHAIAELRRSDSVDYRTIMQLKRQGLEELCASVLRQDSDRTRALHEFRETHPLVDRYARFRAAYDQSQTPWMKWPERMRHGDLQPGDYDEDVHYYYLYAQWIADEQMEALHTTTNKTGVGLYLDLPLGIRPDGFDAWHFQECFVNEARVGAPPDTVFRKGQNWGFPPIHPERIREHHYQYVIEYLRHHLQYSNLLRIDHVMGMHRLYWIPLEASATDGVYVQYHAEELYAITTLESHRFQAGVIGENLGTVPSYVNRSMSSHGIGQMHILQYALDPKSEDVIGKPPRGGLASLNTHDMPTFAAFWNGDDIHDRLDLGLLKEDEAAEEQQVRAELKERVVDWLIERGGLSSKTDDTAAIVRACLESLATGPSDVLLVNLEDLWLERQPQNVPGTHNERPNWQRKARYSFEEFSSLPAVVETLKTIGRLRLAGTKEPSKHRRKGA